VNLPFLFQLLLLFLPCLSYIQGHVIQGLAKGAWTTQIGPSSGAIFKLPACCRPRRACRMQFGSFRLGIVSARLSQFRKVR
jgi:hypothetical protein